MRVQESLVSIERVEGKWGVVLYARVGCNVEDSMVLAKFELNSLDWAEEYKRNLLAVFRAMD